MAAGATITLQHDTMIAKFNLDTCISHSGEMHPSGVLQHLQEEISINTFQSQVTVLNDIKLVASSSGAPHRWTTLLLSAQLWLTECYVLIQSTSEDHKSRRNNHTLVTVSQITGCWAINLMCRDCEGLFLHWTEQTESLATWTVMGSLTDVFNEVYLNH